MTGSVEPGDAERLVVFAKTRRRVDQQALGRFIRDTGLPDRTREDRAAARALFMELAPLQTPGVEDVSRSLLASAEGRDVASVGITVWPSLVSTTSGQVSNMEWSRFAAWHSSLATQVYAKGAGIVYSPTATSDGHRAGASVTHVNALVLDADGTGDWTEIWDFLTGKGFAVMAHRSGGHQASIPKWRLILPLHEPFSTASQEGREAWRSVYSSCRVVFGSIARLRGWGFDPATSGPAHGWFPGYRRSIEAEPREVRWSYGACLDLGALVPRLPRDPVVPPALGAGPAAGSQATSLLRLAFQQSEMLGRDLGGGRTAVLCPWNSLHSDPLPPGADPTSSTVIFVASSGANIGGFHCLHASCGPKAPEEVLEQLPAEAVVLARELHKQAAVDDTGTDPSRLPYFPTWRRDQGF